TGWIHRLDLRRRGIRALSGVEYRRVDDAGLHVSIDGEERVLDVDHVVLCAGQLSRRELADSLSARGVETHVIGGAKKAAELDAKRAIREGYELALSL
ncbi:MAG: NADPH-dependent 2,4-dienoyl-CoA reductase, partial [Xanthomonadales bacterium]|nr:NADPH-dependent 2,4-dienoyl-CoA reductase [Xanthomonadales bacterium]